VQKNNIILKNVPSDIQTCGIFNDLINEKPELIGYIENPWQLF